MSAPIDGAGSEKRPETLQVDANAGPEDGPDLDLWGEAVELGGQKRRGRPKGALNNHTKDFEKWYFHRGYTDPLEKMAAFMSAPPEGLMKFIMQEAGSTGVSKTALKILWEIIKEQHSCASILAPYLHGKKPIQIAVTDERLPQLAIVLGTDQITLARSLEEGGVLSLGNPLDDDEAEPNEINRLDE